MDIQMKKGLIEVCVLAAILNEDSYGYKIIEDLKPCISVSESTLYHILRRLEEARLLENRQEIYNGRVRKYYHITPAGIDRVKQFLSEWQEIMTIYRFVNKEEKEYAEGRIPEDTDGEDKPSE